jgi:hypothetical protein
MFVFCIEENKTTPGPDVLINCPACGKQTVWASTHALQTRSWWFGIIPGLAVYSTWATCLECKEPLISRLPLTELSDKSPDELAALIYRPFRLLETFMALAAFIVAIFPIVGLVMAGLAVFANWKDRGWRKKLSMTALGISGLMHLLFGIGMILEKMGIIS